MVDWEGTISLKRLVSKSVLITETEAFQGLKTWSAKPSELGHSVTAYKWLKTGNSPHIYYVYLVISG
jgi:hypothetical protein